MTQSCEVGDTSCQGQGGGGGGGGHLTSRLLLNVQEVSNVNSEVVLILASEVEDSYTSVCAAYVWACVLKRWMQK